jgi:hypothetical protein
MPQQTNNHFNTDSTLIAYELVKQWLSEENNDFYQGAGVLNPYQTRLYDLIIVELRRAYNRGVEDMANGAEELLERRLFEAQNRNA